MQSEPSLSSLGQKQAKRNAISEYAKFQQQQQLLPWRPTSGRSPAQPMVTSTAEEHRRESADRGRGRPPPSPTSSPAPSHRQANTDDTSTLTSAPLEAMALAMGAGPRVDKIAPERRHFVIPVANLSGSSALMK
jgi:hypothetical protein